MSELISSKTGDVSGTQLPAELPSFEKKGVVEIGLTPSEKSCKPCEKIEKDQALLNSEEAGADTVKEASKLF